MFDRVYGNELDRHNREVYEYKNDIQTTCGCSTKYTDPNACFAKQNAQKWVVRGGYAYPVK